MSVAFALEASLHDDDCGCDDTRTYADFSRSMRKFHPLVWQWTCDRLPVSEGAYHDAKHAIGGNPKATPDPSRLPRRLQRSLSSHERTEHNRRKARWARFGEPLIEADSLSLSQAALLVTVQDGWARCARLGKDGRAHETHPGNISWGDSKPHCVSGCPAEANC